MASSEDTANRTGHVLAADGVSIYYETQGQGQPLVLLHAGSLSGGMWEPYLTAFAGCYQVITPDLPGHGRSGPPTQGMSYRALADDMVTFIHALDLRLPLIAGFSDGGQIALEIGMRYPSLPRAIAICGVWFKFSDAYRAWVRDAVGDDGSPEVDPARFVHNHPEWAAWLEQIHGPDRWTPLLTLLKRTWTTPLNYSADDFAAVVAPTLVMIGDRDELVPVEQAAEMFRQLKSGELAVVPGANHRAFIATKVSTFQSLVLEFLLRHSE